VTLTLCIGQQILTETTSYDDSIANIKSLENDVIIDVLKNYVRSSTTLEDEKLGMFNFN
jgi:hypothetical protein